MAEQRLPFELLAMITDHVAVPDFLNWILACKTIHHLARRQIERHGYLSNKLFSLTLKPKSNQPLRKLLEIWKMPQLAEYPKRIYIEEDPDGVRYNKRLSDNQMSCVLQLMRRTPYFKAPEIAKLWEEHIQKGDIKYIILLLLLIHPEVRAFRCDNGWYWGTPDVRMSSMLDPIFKAHLHTSQQPLSKLHTIEVSTNPQWSSEDIPMLNSLSVLPSLQRIHWRHELGFGPSATDVTDMFPEMGVDPDDGLAGMSNMKIFELRSSALPPEDLAAVLTRFSSLTRFAYTGFPSSPIPRPYVRDIGCVLQRTISHSLQHLSFVSKPGFDDFSFVSFRQFEVLRYACIDIELAYDPQKRRMLPLHKMFAPSLEALVLVTLPITIDELPELFDGFRPLDFPLLRQIIFQGIVDYDYYEDYRKAVRNHQRPTSLTIRCEFVQNIYDTLRLHDIRMCHQPDQHFNATATMGTYHLGEGGRIAVGWCSDTGFLFFEVGAVACECGQQAFPDDYKRMLQSCTIVKGPTIFDPGRLEPNMVDPDELVPR